MNESYENGSRKLGCPRSFFGRRRIGRRRIGRRRRRPCALLVQPWADHTGKEMIAFVNSYQRLSTVFDSYAWERTSIALQTTLMLFGYRFTLWHLLLNLGMFVCD